MRYRHVFTVRAPLEAVADFHARPASLRTLTPPPLRVQIDAAPDVMVEGSEMRFRLGFGPIAIPWKARLEAVTPTGFHDRQLAGPFRAWMHQHSYRALDADHTEVRDQIDAQLAADPLHFLLGLGMWLGMPLLFAYRGWQTRRQLARR
jgi:ligand-binding SRPBCC domain-containing protein